MPDRSRSSRLPPPGARVPKRRSVAGKDEVAPDRRLREARRAPVGRIVVTVESVPPRGAGGRPPLP
ncbi:MAG: hypothetical protein M3256_09570, partial [Actinomycetota bacterium]|nr:hypothetical protein [Actinomycetota bacterium]